MCVGGVGQERDPEGLQKRGPWSLARNWKWQGSWLWGSDPMLAYDRVREFPKTVKNKGWREGATSQALRCASPRARVWIPAPTLKATHACYPVPRDGARWGYLAQIQVP